MTVEPYYKDLGQSHYSVIAPNVGWDNDCFEYYGVELKIAPVETTEFGLNRYKNSLNELAARARTDEDDASDGYTKPYDKDFFANYRAIILGKRPDWVLNGFKVFYGGMYLTYVNKTEGSGLITVANTRDTYLKFIAPQTRYGFEPTYEVEIRRDVKGVVHRTIIREDLGYVRYEKKIKLKNAQLPPGNDNHLGNEYIVGRMFSGI